jgi:hypothetical protein
MRAPLHFQSFLLILAEATMKIAVAGVICGSVVSGFAVWVWLRRQTLENADNEVLFDCSNNDTRRAVDGAVRVGHEDEDEDDDDEGWETESEEEEELDDVLKEAYISVLVERIGSLMRLQSKNPAAFTANKLEELRDLMEEYSHLSGGSALPLAAPTDDLIFDEWDDDDEWDGDEFDEEEEEEEEEQPKRKKLAPKRKITKRR